MSKRLAGTFIRKLMNNVFLGSGSVIIRRHAKTLLLWGATYELARTETRHANKYKLESQMGIQVRRETAG